MGKGSKEVKIIRRRSSEDIQDDRALTICCYAYWMIGVCFGIIIIIVYLTKYDSGSSGSYSGGGGVYFAGGRYGGGWGSGGRGGYFSADSLVWTKNESPLEMLNAWGNKICRPHKR